MESVKKGEREGFLIKIKINFLKNPFDPGELEAIRGALTH
jgi:hypothetical protein